MHQRHEAMSALMQVSLTSTATSTPFWWIRLLAVSLSQVVAVLWLANHNTTYTGSRQEPVNPCMPGLLSVLCSLGNGVSRQGVL